MKGLRITYIVDSENMSDSEYEDQKEKEVIITIDELKPYLERIIPLFGNQTVVWSDSSIDVVK